MSPAAVGVGAGAVVAAGLVCIFFALAGSGLKTSEDEDRSADVADSTTVAADDSDDDHRPAWPPKTSQHAFFD